MKKLLLLVLLILIGCSSPEPVDFSLLYKEDGLFYRRDNGKIFSGQVYNINYSKTEFGHTTVRPLSFLSEILISNEQVRSSGKIKKGRWDGTISFIYKGEVISESKYSKGKQLYSYFPRGGFIHNDVEDDYEFSSYYFDGEEYTRIIKKK